LGFDVVRVVGDWNAGIILIGMSVGSEEGDI